MNGTPPSGPPGPDGDPWAAFGYLVAGVLAYGLLGWGLSIWLHSRVWIPIGILLGAAFGLYMVFSRYSLRGSDKPAPRKPTKDEAAPRSDRPDGDDRGETA
jgi:ATP synthase protein I